MSTIRRGGNADGLKTQVVFSRDAEGERSSDSHRDITAVSAPATADR